MLSDRDILEVCKRSGHTFDEMELIVKGDVQWSFSVSALDRWKSQTSEMMESFLKTQLFP